jgi:hypothetical protein
LHTRSFQHVDIHIQHINDLRGNSSNRYIINSLEINGRTIYDISDIANFLNEYFTNIKDVYNIKSSRITPNNGSLDKLEEFVNTRVPNFVRFTIPFIKENDVLNFLRKLDITKATGLDGLSPKLLRLSANVISTSITKLINYCIINSTFPYSLKHAKVFPSF